MNSRNCYKWLWMIWRIRESFLEEVTFAMNDDSRIKLQCMENEKGPRYRKKQEQMIRDREKRIKGNFWYAGRELGNQYTILKKTKNLEICKNKNKNKKSVVLSGIVRERRTESKAISSELEWQVAQRSTH